MNNLKLIENTGYLNFREDGDFYFIQIFKRRKDNPDLELGVKRLKSYCVYSIKELTELFPKIIQKCKENNARAYIRLNKQNAKDVTLRCIEQLSKNIRTGNLEKGRTVWDAVAGQGGSKEWWAVDIDAEHIMENPLIDTEIRSILQHYFEVDRKIKFECNKVETLTGVHLIVRPFDIRILHTINRQFQHKKIPNIQVQKDCNTLLYAN